MLVRRVEAGQQLVDNDQQAHLAWVLDELLLDRLLELLDSGDGDVFGLVEVVGKHLSVGVVLADLLGLTLAGVFLRDVAGVGRVAGDDGALALEATGHEQVVELARLVDAGADQHRVAAPVHQAGLGFHVEQDVVDDLLGSRLAGDDLLHRAPALLEFGLAEVGHALGLDVKPLVDLLRAGQVLVDVAGFVAQIEHHAVRDRFVELVGVDEGAEGLDARGPVGLEQRRAGEADEHGTR